MAHNGRNPAQARPKQDDSKKSQTGATSRHPDFPYSALDTAVCAAFIKDPDFLPRCTGRRRVCGFH